jgi:hypothetical protein
MGFVLSHLGNAKAIAAGCHLRRPAVLGYAVSLFLKGCIRFLGGAPFEWFTKKRRRYMKTIVMMLALAIAAPMAFTACDRTVEESSKTTTSDGVQKSESKTVTQDPNGNVTVTKEKSTNVTNP